MPRRLAQLAAFLIPAILGHFCLGDEPARVPPPVRLDSPEGQRLLTESKWNQDFVPLSLYFTTQENLAYCGVASASIVLNALPIERPVLEKHGDYRLFDQKNLFNERVARVVNSQDVARDGLTLDQLGKVLSAYTLTVGVTHASDTDLATFRKSVNQAIRVPDTYVIVNYDRRALGQQGAGHISPIAAYHEGTDRYLIMDVARYRYPPVWAGAGELWSAMRSVDAASGKSRGYIIVAKPADRK
jgi:Phytochelatin synthase